MTPLETLIAICEGNAQTVDRWIYDDKTLEQSQALQRAKDHLRAAASELRFVLAEENKEHAQ